MNQKCIKFLLHFEILFKYGNLYKNNKNNCILYKFLEDKIDKEDKTLFSKLFFASNCFYFAKIIDSILFTPNSPRVHLFYVHFKRIFILFSNNILL